VAELTEEKPFQKDSSDCFSSNFRQHVFIFNSFGTGILKSPNTTSDLLLYKSIVVNKMQQTSITNHACGTSLCVTSFNSQACQVDISTCLIEVFVIGQVIAYDAIADNTVDLH